MKKIRYILMMALGVCAMMAGCQELDSPTNNIPTIQTGDATEITATSATITAILSNGTASGRVIFQISTSEDMSDAYESENMLLRNLAPGTTYYYIAMMRSFDGKNEVKGEMTSFTTNSSIRLESVMLTDWEGKTENVTWDFLGTYLITDNGEFSLYGGYGNMYTTKKYDSATEKDLWNLPKEIVPPANTPLKLCAYFPYIENKKADDMFVRVDTYKYDDEIMWGCSETITDKNPVAHIKMKQVLSRIILLVKAGEHFNSNTTITSVVIMDNGKNLLPTGADLDIATGEFGNRSYMEDGNFRQTNITPTDEASQAFMNLIPSEFGEKTVSLLLSTSEGHSIKVDFPASSWEAGKVYEYPVTIDDAVITIGDVTIREWENNEGGDITVND